MFEAAFSVILFSCLLGRLDCPDNNQITVKRGEKATLECYNSTGADVLMLKWKKQGLQSEQEDEERYVFYIRDDRIYENFQLPSFRGRVKLRDPQMKDGDFTVIIKNVSMNDSGVYECYAGYGGGAQLINSTNLKVEESGESGHRGGQSGDGGKKDEEEDGEERGSVGLIVGLIVLVVLIVAAVVGFIIYKKQKVTHDPVNPNEYI